MDFVVIDVETANPNARSICQIGIASFRSGRLSGLWGSLVDPEDSFSAFNQSIHGIRSEHVIDAPNWMQVQREIRTRVEQRTLASHTYFDLRAVKGANERYGLDGLPCTGWLDTCKIARAAWPHLSSHKLTALARVFGIAYQAHNATEDARCAGEILLLAAHATGYTLEELLLVKRKSASATGNSR
jgi:DNA polymerase-3 subunit epsilon